MRTRFQDIGRRDHFEAPRREIVGALLADLDLQLQEPRMNAQSSSSPGTLDRHGYRIRTSVTRAQAHVDRMASAWLIRRYIDPDTRFVFSTDEVLLRRFGLAAPGLKHLAQMIHDIDLKESRYGHAETSGVAAGLDAIAAAAPDDDARTAMAGTVLDRLLARFARA